MMLATTRAAILRSTEVDGEFDMDDDEAAPVAGLTDFPAAITETNDSVFDQSSATWRTVRKLVGRIPLWVSIAPGDRIRDNRTGLVYLIDEVQRQNRSVSGRGSVTLTLRRTGS